MIIALCGFMTSGKTLAGEALSKKTGKRLIDLDQYIEQKEGLKMEDIFKEKGEPYFRKKEEECLKQIVEKEDDIILSLGGGTPMNPNCYDILKEKTRCIFLTCSPKVLAARMLLLQDGRPLVKNLLANHKSSTPEEKLQILEQWAKEKLQEREPIYKACSVKTVDTSDWNIERILKHITMNHPYTDYEKSDNWAIIEKSVNDLIENNDIELKTPIEYVIGYICKALQEKNTENER